MPTQNEPVTIYERGWILRYKPPLNPTGRRVILLIHGWTGDENVMWVFARNLPADYWVLAPRGLVKAPSGYGWNSVDQLSAQYYSDYARTGESLMEELGYWLRRFKIGPGPVDLMGFSQGAAMCYSLLAGHPERVGKTAALAGFLPQGIDEGLYPQRLVGKELFIAHGTRDETIPVHAARHAADVFEHAGVQVTYCEDDVGHKLGASCNKGLAAFFNSALTAPE